MTVTTASIDTARELEVLNCMQAFMVIGVRIRRYAEPPLPRRQRLS